MRKPLTVEILINRRKYKQKNAIWQNHGNNCYKKELILDVKISRQRYDRKHDIYIIARLSPHKVGINYKRENGDFTGEKLKDTQLKQVSWPVYITRDRTKCLLIRCTGKSTTSLQGFSCQKCIARI